MIGNFYIGQRPPAPLSIQVIDNDGVTVNLGGYDKVTPIMLDPQNNRVDMTGTEVVRGSNGQISLALPKDRSLFEKAGEYVMQLKLEITSLQAVDYTSEYTIQIRKLGGK